MAKKLKIYRVEHDLNQTELAQKAGVSQDEISKLERGKRKGTLETQNRIAEALGVYRTDIKEFNQE